MKNKDFLYNLSREGFKLRVNKMSVNSTFCAVASAYVSKRSPVYVFKQIWYKQLGNISIAQTQAQVGVWMFYILQKIGNKRKVVFRTSPATSVLTALACPTGL